MTDSQNPEPEKEKKSFSAFVAHRLRSYFITGILVTAPISITFYIAWSFISFVDRLMAPMMPTDWRYQSWEFPGMGLLVAILALTLLGWVMAGVLGRLWLNLSGRIMTRMPILSGVYSTLKQLFETVLANKSQAFREVGLIEYPRRGIWTIVFVTGAPPPRISREIDEKQMLAVFVPTTPNPTSGFLLFVPEKDVKILDLTVEEGLKLVISTGIVAPDEEKGVKKGVSIQKPPRS